MRARVLTLPVIAIVLAGCATSNPQATTAPGASQNPSQAQPAPPAATSTAAPTQLPVLGSRLSADGDIPLEIALREVRSGSGAMTVTFSVTNHSTAGKNWSVWGYFDDGISQVPGQAAWTTDGVAVIDTAGAKRYLPARSADHHCMCSEMLNGTNIAPDQTVYFSDVYQALPADLNKVSVEIPHAGIFGDVPVTR